MDLMARRRAIMGMPSGKDYTVSGNVVSISNALAKNAKSLIVSFSPKQSGSGDPSPNNIRPITGYNDIGAVRYGKNLLPKTQLQSQTVNGTTFTVNDDGSITVSGTPTTQTRVYVASGQFWTPKVTEIFSSGTMPSGTRFFCSRVRGGTTSYPTISPTGTAQAGDVYSNLLLEVNTSFGGTAFTCYPMIEYGNTATPYEPYISPVTANVHVGGAGKNKFNVNISDVQALGWNVAFPFTIKKAGTYIMSCQKQFGGTTNKGASISLRDANNNILKNLTGYDFGDSRFVAYAQEITEEIAMATTTIYFSCRESMDSTEIQSIIDAEIQLEEGSTATTYEPYSLFGGTVDLVSGECVMDKVFETITGNSNWYSFSTGTGNSSAVVQLNHWDNVKYTSGNASYNGAIGSSGREAQNYWTSARQNEVPNEGDMAFAYSYTGQLRVHRSDVANITDLASFKTAFVDLQICYPLATPITYQLTPSQLALLKGNNTVYSNEGSISLTYVGK